VFFSLFGRKKTESKKAPIVRQPVKPSPEKSATPVASPQAGEDSLDFSSYVPPPPQSAPRQDSPAPTLPSVPLETAAAAAAPPLDVSALAASLAAQPGAAPSIEASPAAAAAIIKETAILFANGEVEPALARLANAVREAELGDSALQAWLMLFDLLQHLDMWVEFEALALEFVVKFERSPPAWLETAETHDPELDTGGVAYFALGGALNEASAPELEKLRTAAAAQRTLRVECGKLESVDGPGCRLLRETLLSLRDAEKEVLLTGEARLIQFLQEACQPERIETDAAVWALLLDVYRILDFKDKFEETAVNYAVTFEVSPPSWAAARAS
jgi:ABC-type transporter Mla MlaB component